MLGWSTTHLGLCGKAGQDKIPVTSQGQKEKCTWYRQRQDRDAIMARQLYLTKGDILITCLGPLYLLFCHVTSWPALSPLAGLRSNINSEWGLLWSPLFKTATYSYPSPSWHYLLSLPLKFFFVALSPIHQSRLSTYLFVYCLSPLTRRIIGSIRAVIFDRFVYCFWHREGIQ